MTEDFVHEEWDMAAVGYAMAALEDGEQRTFEEHLDSCQRCQRTVAEASSIGAALGTSAPVPVPAAELRGRVLGAALATRPSTTTLSPQVDGTSRPPVHRVPTRVTAPEPSGEPAPVVPIHSRHARHAASKRNPARTALSAIAAVLVVAVAAAFVSVVRDRDREKSVADARSRTISSLQHQITQVIPIVLRTFDKKSALVGTAYVQGRTITIVSSSLKQNDPTVHSYVLWSIAGTAPNNLKFKPLVRFNVTKGSPGVQKIELPADINFKAFPIFGWSIEPGAGLPSAPTKVIGVGSP
jgi:anti-sigma-K factor RskA